MRARTILISGIGIAGPTLAYWLQKAGFAPTLIERAPALRRGGYVIDFWGLGYDIAERMGLRAAIERIGYHARELRIVDDRGRRIAGFGTEVFAAVTGGRYVTLGRSDLSRLLVERLGGSTELLFGDEIVALEQSGDQVAVAFKHAPPRRFDLVIGADGLHSGVRKLVFGPRESFEHSLGYCVAAFEAPGYRPREDDIYAMYGRPGRMVGRFTLRDDRTLFLFVFAAEPDARLFGDPAAQKALLHTRYGDGGWESGSIMTALDCAAELYFDRVSLIDMPRWSQGRVALLGDAAFCVSLVTGQGSALAMTAAYVLAGELARAEGDHAEAFARYEARLRDFIGAKQKGAARFAGAFAPKTRWGLFLRNQIIQAARIPGLARLAIGRDIVDKLRLPDYGMPTNAKGAR